MGLLTVLRKVRQKERELRVLMVGLDNAGKTTVTAALTGGDPSATAPTVGFEIRTLVVQGRLSEATPVDGQGNDAAPSTGQGSDPTPDAGQDHTPHPSTTHPTSTPPRRVNIWDVGGQKTLRPFWRNYFESTDGLVWVVDAADRARLGDAARELSLLLAEARLAAVPLLVLANKQDVAGAASADDVAAALGLTAAAGAGAAPAVGGRPWRVAPTAARRAGAAAGVAAAFDWLLDAVAEAAWAGVGVREEEEADG